MGTEVQSVIPGSTHCIAPVHGTFDPHPEWVVEGAVFYNAFHEVLRQKRFTLSPMSWSAGNTFRSRYAGALMLRRKIIKLFRESDRLYLVSHSHGGNVAVKATNTDKLWHVRLVTIGTPFIRLEKESLATVDTIFTTLFWYAGLFPWAIYLATYPFDRLVLPSLNTLPSFLQFIAIMAVIPMVAVVVMILVGTGIVLYFLVRDLLTNIETNKRDRGLRSFVNFAPPANKMLCIYTRFDEAFLALKASTVVLRTLHYVAMLSMIVLIGALLFVGREYKLEIIRMFFGEFGVKGALSKVPACRVCKPEESEILIAYFSFFPASLVVASIMLVRLVGKLILFRFAFGMFDLPTALRTRIVVTRVPWKFAGRVDTMCLDLVAWSWGRFRFRHSELVRDRSVALAIMRWIERDARAPVVRPIRRGSRRYNNPAT